jgi:DNA-binding GntR family transcriptional regulator
MAAHEELMTAVGDRDSAAAARIMKDHVKTTGQFVLDSIQLSRV